MSNINTAPLEYFITTSEGMIITMHPSRPVQSGELVVGKKYELIFDGENFVLQKPKRKKKT